jgi:hypothetical protein
MAERPVFRRIVVGFPYHTPSRGMRLAAEMARLLQLDLFGLFIQEESLFGVAALPFAREFKFLAGEWRPFDVEHLSRDFEVAAKNAEQSFTEAVKTLQTACHFEVVRGSMVETIGSIARAGDIVVLVEAESPAECASHQSLAILDAALHSAAAVLLIPGRIARHSGAIVAIASAPDDPSIEAARVIATAAKEELVIVEGFKPTDKDHASARDAPTGIRIRRVPVTDVRLRSALAIGSVLGQVHERLVVMTRSDECQPLSIASLRQVPILIVEPAK